MEKPKDFYPEAVINTIWLVENINNPDKHYGVLAHELGHIFLFDGQHNGDLPGNLMSIPSRRTPHLPIRMCDEIRLSPLLLPVRKQ